jgi:hypothetical protein
MSNLYTVHISLEHALGLPSNLAASVVPTSSSTDYNLTSTSLWLQRELLLELTFELLPLAVCLAHSEVEVKFWPPISQPGLVFDPPLCPIIRFLFILLIWKYLDFIWEHQRFLYPVRAQILTWSKVPLFCTYSFLESCFTSNLSFGIGHTGLWLYFNNCILWSFQNVPFLLFFCLSYCTLRKW